MLVRNPAILGLAAVGALTTMCAIICCYGRAHPTNLVLLLVFTICESVSVAAITTRYEFHSVVMAGLTTALVTISLTVYAFRTKENLSYIGGLACVACLALIPMVILNLFIGSPFIALAISVGIIILYSLFLIYDTMTICRKCDSDEDEKEKISCKKGSKITMPVDIVNTEGRMMMMMMMIVMKMKKRK